MKISPVVLSHKNYTFKNNLRNIQIQKPKEKNPLNDLFYIRMSGYEKDKLWAKNMTDLALELALDIQHKADFDYLTEKIQARLEVINASSRYGKIKNKSGCGHFVVCNDCGRGVEYYDKYKKIIDKNNFFKPCAPKKYPNASRVEIHPLRCNRISIAYGYSAGKTSDNFEFMKSEYENLLSIKDPSIAQINSTAATIQWLFAQASPFVKGNDSAANLLTKAIYFANDCVIYPVKKGKSLDFEAFGSQLDDYIKNYPKFFDKKPRKKLFDTISFNH